jgi:D-glycero-D-manno-heptose 1,7-bisphosphate phosphatase
MKKAVFLDRDGTINKEVNYLSHPGQIELIPGSAEGIKLLNEKGFTVVVITNQSGVARGIIDEGNLPLIKDRLCCLLEEKGAKIDGYYYCPHYPDGKIEKYAFKCDCRKPEPGMLRKAAEDLDIDLKRSYVVGDKACDIKLGKNIGAVSIMVKTGYGESEAESCEPSPDYTADNLFGAAQWIIKNNLDQL